MITWPAGNNALPGLWIYEMKKKILFLMALNFWSIAQGKGAPSIYNTVNGYVAKGWDVHVVMRELNPNFGSEPPNLHLYTFDFPRLSKISKKPHLFVPFRFVIWVLSILKFRSIGGKIINKNDIDVVYAYEVDAVPAARFLASRHHIPLVTRFMGTVLADALNSLKTKIALWYHFVALKTRADLVIMTNDGTKGDWVLKQLGNPSPDIRFWVNGVNPVDLTGYDANKTREMLGVPPGCRVLLCVSRLVAWKRLDRSLYAFCKLLDTYKDDIRLVIVGDGDIKQELVKLAEDLGISGKVLFAGGLPQSQVYHLMKLSDIFLSLYDLSNMGNPLFEAMRCGKPIITLNNGDTASIIENNINGIILPDDDVQKIADTIKSLLVNNELSGQLAANAARYAQAHFRTWDERISEEVQLVEKLAGEGPH
jgi:glycosyltransferase involved in cell wall biosynthesis